jgi:hypothetical protein
MANTGDGDVALVAIEIGGDDFRPLRRLSGVNGSFKPADAAKPCSKMMSQDSF